MVSVVGERIRGLRTPNAFGQQFVPFRDLERILDQDTVQTVLWGCGIKVYQREEAQKVILKGGKRVFATLCAIEREGLITQFLKHDNFLDVELDSKLPFEEDALRRIIPDDYRDFYDIQWEFSAPVFRPNLHHRNLHNRCVLPFTKVEKIGEGGFGIVSRILLAGSHQGILQGKRQEVEVVRKELRPFSTQEQDYEHEQHILSLLRCLQHPNIVQFYTAYTLNLTPTLLFAPADCNLAELLSQPRPPRFESDQDIFQALYGLSSAIAHLHNYFSEKNGIRMVGCHYDLKPKNVLVKQSQFILADFGISRLKSEVDGSLSGFKAGVSDYFAPECQNLADGFEKHRIGRGSDVWSFGCILAEIATYIEFGPQGVADFSEKRKITLHGFLAIRPFHAAVEPSKAVRAWLDEIEARESATSPRLGLLTLIRNMLAFDVTKRPDSLNVSARLFLLVQRATVDLVSGSFALLQEEADYGFRVECERFKIWCDSVRIPDVSENGQASSWFLNESARSHFEWIGNALQGVAKELSLQAGILKLEPVEPYNNPTYYVLRKHMDALWNSQPLGVVRRMTSLLERSLLRDHTPDTLFLDSEGKNDPNGYRRIQLLIAMKQAMTSVDAYKHQKPRFLTEEPMKLIGEISGRQLANVGTDEGDQRSVLMEVLEYQDTWVDRFDELLLRVDSLVALLSKPETSALFHMLPCTNFCHLA